MQSVLSWIAIIASAVLLVRVILSRPLLTGLTVIYSWGWAVAACATLIGATIVTAGMIPLAVGWKTAAQYFSVIMLLTPAVSTLGARKPGVHAWQFFVVAPMILVLQWPGASQLLSSHGREAIDLGMPATTGILLVLLMSTGTGLGTSLSVSTLLYIVAVMCCLLPSSAWISSGSEIPLFAPPLLLAAEVLASRIVTWRYQSVAACSLLSETVDQAWILFQDLYGLIWTRRAMDRVNQFATREQWTVLLTLDGFRRRENGESGTETELQKPLEAFCWVLSRFADPAWIDGRFQRWTRN